MKVLVIGAGAIGSIYGYMLSVSGVEVIHYVRENKAEALKDGISVSILDGRDAKNIRKIDDVYKIKTITDFEQHKEFDLILVSIKHGSLEGAFKVIKDNHIKGDILFFNGLWKDFAYVDAFIPGKNYLWGYPVAGGNIDYEEKKLEAAILDSVILGEPDGIMTERFKRAEKIFLNANLKVEVPESILHWIWIHMAINAGIISTCLKYGSAVSFMDNTRALKEGVLTVRETLKIAEARGVDLDKYKAEIKMFYYPVFLSSIVLKYFFIKNVPSRKIMELHKNIEDLYEICADVYKTGSKLKVDIPLFEKKKIYFTKA